MPKIMTALEFSAKIENGIIRLPEQYGEYENSPVKVILLFEQPVPDKKSQLRHALLQMKNKNMFSGIDNPVEWQRKLRDEWE
jgi:hypothetical protein